MDTMTTRYVLFVFTIAALITLVSLPESGYGTPPSLAQYNVNDVNKQIQNGSQNFVQTTVTQAQTTLQTTTITTTTINGTITSTVTTVITTNSSAGQSQIIGQVCTSSGGFLNDLESSICNLDILVHNSLIHVYCGVASTVINTFGINSNYCNAQQQQLASQIGNSLITKSPSIFDLGGGGYSNGVAVVSGNNSLINILSSPLSQAIAIAILFLGLGWLAGTLGAGSLANIMAKVGIAVSLFYYMNAQMSIFGTIPIFIYAFVNIIIDVPTIVLLYESFNQVGAQH